MKLIDLKVDTLLNLYEDELTRALAEDGSPASTFITPKNYSNI